MQSNRLISLLVTRPYSPASVKASVKARVMGSRRSVRRDPSAGIASACSRKKLKPRTVRPPGSCRSQSSHSAPDEGDNQWPSGAIRYHHWQSVAINVNQCPCGWCCYQSQSSAISGNQWQSVAINTPQKAAEASTERSAVYGKARQRPRRRRGSSPRGTCGARGVGSAVVSTCMQGRRANGGTCHAIGELSSRLSDEGCTQR